MTVWLRPLALFAALVCVERNCRQAEQCWAGRGVVQLSEYGTWEAGGLGLKVISKS